MENVDCQGQNAKLAALLARRAAANIELERIKQSVDGFSSYDAYLDALLHASDSVAFLDWECRTFDKLSSSRQDKTEKASFFVSAICSDWTRHLLFISERSGPAAMAAYMYAVVAGAAHGAEAAPRAGTATGAALLFTPHGNHGDNQQ